MAGGVGHNQKRTGAQALKKRCPGPAGLGEAVDERRSGGLRVSVTWPNVRVESRISAVPVISCPK